MPITLIFGLYTDNQTSALTLSVRTPKGTQEAGEWTDDSPWAILARALKECAMMGADAVVLFCNDQPLVRTLQSGAVPTPDKSQRFWIHTGPGRTGHYSDIPYGGDINHWDTLRHLTGYCTRGGWAVKQIDSLPRTEELWRQSRA